MMAYQALEGILKLEKVTSRKVKYLCPSDYFMLNRELVFFPVLWIPSGSALIWLSWIQIRIGNADPDTGAWNWPKLTNKPGFLPFKKIVVPYLHSYVFLPFAFF
jgi:hypothetical protein